MAVASEDLTTQVQALPTLLKGQSTALTDMAATVTSLQTTVGGINTNVADLSAKTDQLLNSIGNRNDCAMGVGRDSASDSEPRKKVKVLKGADGQTSGAAAGGASASA